VQKCAICGSIFDSSRLRKELAAIETQVSDPAVWADATRSQPLMRERKRIEASLKATPTSNVAPTISRLTLTSHAKERTSNPNSSAEIEGIESFVEKLETRPMLGGETDGLNAIVTVHPGAGGTESQDWAEMLLRMYLRWAERQGFKTEINEIQDG